MSTFQEVNDDTLIKLISCAQSLIVFVAPGIHQSVAKALRLRIEEIEHLQVKVVIDPDGDVCRIGYCDAIGLESLGKCADEKRISLTAHSGLRIGVLLVDGTTLVWSPTPRSVEPVPSGYVDSQTVGKPNGLLLASNPNGQLMQALAADPFIQYVSDAEIGVQEVTKEQVEETLEALAKNPPIPVELARITSVFSTKLQFAELSVIGAKLSKRELKISNDYMNADIQGELKGLVDSKLRAFIDFTNAEVEVPAFNNGHAAYDKDQNRLTEKVSEASLQRTRNELERRYLFNVPGFGRLIAKDDKLEFVRLVAAYEMQLEAYSTTIRERLDEQAPRIIEETTKLVAGRMERIGKSPNKDYLREIIMKGMASIKDEVPKVNLVFKDVTYEQTKNSDFCSKIDKCLPFLKRKKLGNWNQDFIVAEASSDKLII
jgi:hypothetical protein